VEVAGPECCGEKVSVSRRTSEGGKVDKSRAVKKARATSKGWDYKLKEDEPVFKTQGREESHHDRGLHVRGAGYAMKMHPFKTPVCPKSGRGKEKTGSRKGRDEKGLHLQTTAA